MPRLIDGDALKALIIRRRKEAKTLTGIDMVMVIDDAPTVDAVLVTRCKDCINWDTEWTTHPPDHYCHASDQFTSADFYCGYSEKKEVEEQQCTSTDTEH